jgi:hypothetical protein
MLTTFGRYPLAGDVPRGFHRPRQVNCWHEVFHRHGTVSAISDEGPHAEAVCCQAIDLVCP